MFSSKLTFLFSNLLNSLPMKYIPNPSWVTNFKLIKNILNSFLGVLFHVLENITTFTDDSIETEILIKFMPAASY